LSFIMARSMDGPVIMNCGISRLKRHLGDITLTANYFPKK